MTWSLNLVRLVLDRRELMRMARRHGLGRGVDEGYLLHAGLAQLFATSSQPARVPLQTFALDDTLRQAREHPELVFLLAYSEFDEAALLHRMGASVQSLVRCCESHCVPSIAAGMRAAFRVRVCPIVRTRLPVTTQGVASDGGPSRIREVDAWLTSPEAQSGRAGGAIESRLPFEHSAHVWSGREAVYGRWVARELARSHAAVLEGPPRMSAFKRDRLYRRGVESRRVLERPNAVMEGVLRVETEEGFRTLLHRGLGRHRAFGFGMLLLDRPQADSC